MRGIIKKAEKIIENKGVKCLIFDLDGTLLFTEEANCMAYKNAFREVGISFDEKKYRESFGLRYREMICNIAPDLTESKIVEIKKIKAKHYKKNIQLIKPNDMLVEFLKKNKKKYITCLISTASKRNAAFLLRHFGILNDFNYIAYGEDMMKPKPHPECFVVCMNKFRVDPKETLIFEDSETGIKAAKNSGANYIKVKNKSININK